jgi:hypothetical protein
VVRNEHDIDTTRVDPESGSDGVTDFDLEAEGVSDGLQEVDEVGEVVLGK